MPFTSTPAAPRLRRIVILATVAGWTCVALGAAVIVGWLLRVGLLKTVLPGLASMSPSTAVAFAAAGGSLLLLLPEDTGRPRRAGGLGLAGLVFLAGLAALAGYGFQTFSGIDGLLIADSNGALAGRMAGGTAVGLLLAGVGLLTLDVEFRRAFRPAQPLAILVAVIGLVGLTGYAFDAQGLRDFGGYASMALHTAFGLLVLGPAILGARPDRGVMRIVVSDGLGGATSRPLLAAAVAVPLLIGFGRLQGEVIGLYSSRLGVALFAVSNVVVLAAVVLWTGFRLDAADSKRRATVDELRRLNISLEQRVADRTADLSVSNKELEAFAYSVSHDLRAPLRSLQGFSQILQDDFAEELSDEAQHDVVMIQESAREMGYLIDDLLEFSRLGRRRLEVQSVDPARVARQALAELASETEGRVLEINVDPMPPCDADPTLLRLVYQNLLGNAIKYTKAREPAKIRASSKTQDGQTLYFVEDNGIGFDPQYAQKIFGIFERLHRSEAYPGTGVGLAVVQRIVHRHGGRVWADAAPDRGATFYFTIRGGNP